VTVLIVVDLAVAGVLPPHRAVSTSGTVQRFIAQEDTGVR
jgi:hypothetical protein